jgi:tRNA(fMet)-specific endonuclease VapC
VLLLDTNICIYLLNNRQPALIEKFRQHSPQDIALCSIVKAELLSGARRSERVEANMQRLKTFFAPLQSLPFDDRCAEHYGAIHADLSQQGTLIGPNDLLIAAIARANDATLITHNTREFNRVIGLRVEDWQSAVSITGCDLATTPITK